MKLRRIAQLNRMLYKLRCDLESNAPVDEIKRPYTMRSIEKFERKRERIRRHEAELEHLIRQEFGDLLK